MTVTMEANEQVLSLDGTFDGSAFCRVQDFILATAGRIVLDFHAVHLCQPFALAKLAALLADAETSVRARGLCHHHFILLSYLGFSNSERPVEHGCDALR